MEKRNSDFSFICSGFNNWKDGTVAFKDHQSTVAYKMALQLVVDLPSPFADVGECYLQNCTREKESTSRVC